MLELTTAQPLCDEGRRLRFLHYRFWPSPNLVINVALSRRSVTLVFFADGLYLVTVLRKTGAKVTVYARHLELKQASKQASMQAPQPKRESPVAVLCVGVPCLVTLAWLALWGCTGGHIVRKNKRARMVFLLFFSVADCGESSNPARRLVAPSSPCRINTKSKHHQTLKLLPNSCAAPRCKEARRGGEKH